MSKRICSWTMDIEPYPDDDIEPYPDDSTEDEIESYNDDNQETYVSRDKKEAIILS